MSNAPQAILIDTCVLLEDPNVITRIRNRGGIPFLTGTVLDEIDHKKNGSDKVNKNARAIFRELNKAPSTKVQNMPTGQDLLSGDILSRFVFEGGFVFLISRSAFKSQTNNDGKIIELAKDYGMLLLTRDGGMRVRADADGVTAVLWNGGHQTDNKADRRAESDSHRTSPLDTLVSGVKPFNLPQSPITEKDRLTPVAYLPKEGDSVVVGSGQKIRLGPLINAGGEGSIYQTGSDGVVCKIYHADKLTALRRKKIELMVSRKIERPGICWPTDIVMNDRAEFVGYLMPRAMGKTIQSSMFVKPVLEKSFPQWRRLDLVNLCIAFLEHIRYLHSLNIIVGDINPMNLLVTMDSTKLWMVDTDSFQIENFPCPVGTVNFTAPEIQGRNYTDFLRTKEHELFAVGTMLFMLLHPGKPPYSQQGGGSPVDNIRAMDFPYRFRKDDDEYGGKNVPHGPWQLIWSNLPYHVKEAFHNTFRENKRTSINEWLKICQKYQTMLSRGHTSVELFPSGYKVRDPIDVTCGKCGKVYTGSKQWVEKILQQGNQPWCPDCANRAKLERLARQSMRDAQQAVQDNQGSKSGIGSASRQPAYTPFPPLNATPPKPTWTPPPKPSWTPPPASTQIPPPKPTGTPRPSARSYSSSSSRQQPASTGGLIKSILKFFFK